MSAASPPTPPRGRLRQRKPPTAGVRARREWKERGVGLIMLLAGFSSVVITAAIVLILVRESWPFFRHVNLLEFLTGTKWTPQFDRPHYGILPLLSGTFVTTGIALLVALPVGTIVAIYLSEFAPTTVRETVKPTLELLSAVPTVVYGYFALQFVTPLLQMIIPGLPTFNMLSAGIVMGIMIIPYVSSFSEDAMRSVPMILREGSFALGGNKLVTAIRVVLPSALSGIGAAYVLGISRAVGETMIVAVAAGTQARFTLDPTQPAATITAFIAQVSLGDLPHGSTGYQSIFAAGITLFLITLFFNVIGHILRRRYHQAY